MLTSGQQEPPARPATRPDSLEEPGRSALCGGLSSTATDPAGDAVQIVPNSEGELVRVLDASDLENAIDEARDDLHGMFRSLVTWLATGGLLMILAGTVYVVRASDRSERVEAALTAHLEDAGRRDENLTAILRMTDSLRIEMRHLTAAIERGVAK